MSALIPHRDFGIGCNHLTEYEKMMMVWRGLNPSDLVEIEALATNAKLEALCRGGMPRYWHDSGSVLIHPSEVLGWALQTRTWCELGAVSGLLIEAQAWALESRFARGAK